MRSNDFKMIRVVHYRSGSTRGPKMYIGSDFCDGFEVNKSECFRTKVWLVYLSSKLEILY